MVRIPSRTGCQPVRGRENALATRSTVSAHWGRLALPCRHAGRVPLLAVVVGQSSYRWYRLANNGNRNASNELNDVKYVNVLNEITHDIAFEEMLCYNHAKKEKNHEA